MISSALNNMSTGSNGKYGGAMGESKCPRSTRPSDKSCEAQSLSDLVVRAVGAMAERYRMEEELRRLAITDELTGLYNRRGFHTLAGHQLMVSQRADRELVVVLVDVDGLKLINDTLGHRQGDMALLATTDVLRKTFRKSDIVCRWGGDEFVILTIEAEGLGESAITARLEENLKKFNAGDAPYPLSLSVGMARLDPRKTSSIGELIELADQAMFERKQMGTETAATSASDNGDRQARSWGMEKTQTI
jgi:diguanylate cyclase (GGDEF)-like protein